MVVKKDRGCKADGVYLIDSVAAFQDLLFKDFDSMCEGFLLQEFIVLTSAPNLSNYFRLNIVGGRLQSAVQFQLFWGKAEGVQALKLADFEQAHDRPVETSLFCKQTVEKIISACPFVQETVGIDVMLGTDEKFYLLEYNDGPALSLIVDLGEKYKSNEGAQACSSFTHAIAEFCFKKIDLLLAPTKKITEEKTSYQAIQKNVANRHNAKKHHPKQSMLNLRQK